ncbi:sulfotransferase family protein [Aliishimia ponticola]|uniref:Sulfotransferase family protein n=2 Tax=Aliishimia ponticola TaxID=2499833 RepID=A0A4S4N944_9RHOB|nr:sulfotransferase family protein [Aliishimia ponticola]
MGAQNVKAPVLISRAQKAAKAGDINGAEALFREVLARYPANQRARSGLAGLLASRAQDAVPELLAAWQRGEVETALAMAEDLSAQHPTVRDVRAAALRKLGRPIEALELYDAALAREPKNPKLWYNGGAARLEAHQLGAAHRYLVKACDLSPEPDHLLTLAQCRLEQGYYPEVETLTGQVLARADATPQHKARGYRFLGSALLNQGQHEGAIAAYRAAHEITPRDPELLHDLGIAAAAAGDHTIAAGHFEAALKLAPDHAGFHRALSGVRAYTADDPHLAQMSALLEASPTPVAAAELHFALSKAYEDIGDFPAAAAKLISGNALRRSSLRYDPSRDEALFARLETLASDELDDGDDTTPRPIFIVGLPRSGTTLTEQIIAGAPGVTAAGELPFAGQAAAALLRETPVGAPDEEALHTFAAYMRAGLKAAAKSEPVVIDKMPLNFRWAEILLATLPEARVIWMERGPEMNALSLYRHYFAGSGNGFAYGAEDIAAMIARERERRARVLARFPDRTYRLPLETLTASPEPVIKKLISFCNLEWSEACLSPQSRQGMVLTASNQQVRQAITPSGDTLWQNYAPYLFPLQQALRAQTPVS